MCGLCQFGSTLTRNYIPHIPGPRGKQQEQCVPASWSMPQGRKVPSLAVKNVTVKTRMEIVNNVFVVCGLANRCVLCPFLSG